MVFPAARVPVHQILLSLVFCLTSISAYLIFALLRKKEKKEV